MPFKTSRCQKTAASSPNFLDLCIPAGSQQRARAPSRR